MPAVAFEMISSASTDELRALAHEPQTRNAPLGALVEHFLHGEAMTIVGDFQDPLWVVAAVLRDRHEECRKTDARGGRVLAGVAQRFLRHTQHGASGEARPASLRARRGGDPPPARCRAASAARSLRSPARACRRRERRMQLVDEAAQSIKLAVELATQGHQFDSGCGWIASASSGRSRRPGRSRWSSPGPARRGARQRPPLVPAREPRAPAASRFRSGRSRRDRPRQLAGPRSTVHAEPRSRKRQLCSRSGRRPGRCAAARARPSATLRIKLRACPLRHPRRPSAARAHRPHARRRSVTSFSWFGLWSEQLLGLRIEGVDLGIERVPAFPVSTVAGVYGLVSRGAVRVRSACSCGTPRGEPERPGGSGSSADRRISGQVTDARWR